MCLFYYLFAENILEQLRSNRRVLIIQSERHARKNRLRRKDIKLNYRLCNIIIIYDKTIYINIRIYIYIKIYYGYNIKHISVDYYALYKV